MTWSGTSPATPTLRIGYPRPISRPMTPSMWALRNCHEPPGRPPPREPSGRPDGSTSGLVGSTRWRGQPRPQLARRRMFSVLHPTRQRFTKTDLAKFESTWDQLPHIVSRGAQKNFSDFTIRFGERERVEPDRTYFERLVAKAILFRETERIVQRQNFGGYRANIVTHTMALLCNATHQRLDLERIWREQAIGETLERVIASLSHGVQAIITSPPNGGNITEWCKNEACWDAAARGGLNGRGRRTGG